MIKILIFNSIFVLIPIFAAKFPSDLPRCSYGDNVCLPKVITQIVQEHPNGHSGLGIPPLEPLHINSVDIVQGTNNPISIDMHLRNMDLTGISKVVITKVSGFERDPSASNIEVSARLPKLDLIGQYKINGRVLLLPITGEGKAELSLGNVDIKIKYNPKIIAKNGKDYVQTNRFKLDFDTTKLSINLQNLFNGDKALGDNMNTFLNENWRDILKELKPAINTAIEQIIENLINRIFSKIPYSELFLH